MLAWFRRHRRQAEDAKNVEELQYKAYAHSRLRHPRLPPSHWAILLGEHRVRHFEEQFQKDPEYADEIAFYQPKH